jgi:hypothetical protein
MPRVGSRFRRQEAVGPSSEDDSAVYSIGRARSSMTSAVGSAASTEPGRKSLLPRIPPADHDLRGARDRRVDEDRPIGGQAERSDSAYSMPVRGDRLIMGANEAVRASSRRRTTPFTSARDVASTVHAAYLTAPPRLPLITTQLAETSRPTP